MSLRRAATTALGPALAVLLLWVSFRGVHTDDLTRLLGQASGGLLVLNVLAAPMHLLLRGLRWRSLLHQVHDRIPLSESLSATAIGYLAGVLPARVGEVLRPTLLSRRVGIPFAPTLASAAVERVLLDLLAVLLLGALGLWLPESITGLSPTTSPAWILEFRRVGGIVLLVMLAALLGLNIVARRHRALGGWFDARSQLVRSRSLRFVLQWMADLLPGLAALSDGRRMGIILLQTVAIWVVTAAGMHAGLSAFGLDLPAGAMLIILPVVVAGISIPTPGNFGTFHLAMKLALVSVYGVDEPTAVGVALVVHLCNWLPLVVAGGISLAWGGGVPSSGSAVADSSRGG